MSNLNPLYKGFLVEGSVLDNNQKTIPNVNITDVLTGNTVISDKDGKFSIIASYSDSYLKFSHVAYDELLIKASGSDGFNSYVELLPHSTLLDEVGVMNNSTGNGSNGIFWIIGGLAALLVYSKMSGKQSPKTIQV